MYTGALRADETFTTSAAVSPRRPCRRRTYIQRSKTALTAAQAKNAIPGLVRAHLSRSSSNWIQWNRNLGAFKMRNTITFETCRCQIRISQIFVFSEAKTTTDRWPIYFVYGSNSRGNRFFIVWSAHHNNIGVRQI